MAGRRTAEIGIGLALAAGLAASAAQAGPRIKIQSGYGLSVPVLGETIRHFEERMRALPGHDLRLRLYDVGKLVPPLQIFDAVSAGRIQAGFAFPGYWMGKIPAAAVFSAIPFGPEAPEYLAWLHQGGGLELWRATYAKRGAVPVPCGVLPPEASGWFREPIGKAGDLVGLKIRYAGLGGRVLEKMGASITMLAAGDLFLSLERGVLDATEYSMPAVDLPLGFHKVAKHYYFPGWHQPASLLELIVNKETWDGLAPGQRAAIETACDATTLWGLTRGLAVQGPALASLEKEGVTLHRWSPELMALFRKHTDEVMAEAAAEDAEFAEAWRSLRDFLDSQARWAGMAYAR